MASGIPAEPNEPPAALSPKPSEFPAALRENQTSFKSDEINQKFVKPVDPKNSSKQRLETVDWIQLILVCAIVVWTTIVVVEHIFIKDDALLNFISQVLSLVLGYFFGTQRLKRSAPPETLM